MLKYKLYLNDILRMIKQIEDSLGSKTKSYFEKDVDASEATAMRLQIIGESISKLPENLKENYDSIKWNNFIRFRNVLSHAYFKIDKDMLWDVVENEIPMLKKIVEKIKNEK